MTEISIVVLCFIVFIVGYLLGKNEGWRQAVDTLEDYYPDIRKIDETTD